MTTAGAPMSGALRRRPKQARSRARVDAVLAAAAALIGEVDEADITTALIAERAGIPVGSLYEYFTDRDAVFDALVHELFDDHAAELRAVTATPPATPEAFVHALVDAHAAFFRTNPAFATVRAAAFFARHSQPWVDAEITSLMADVARAGASAGFGELHGRPLAVLRVPWVVADAVVALAFRDDPDGDPVVLALARDLVWQAVRSSIRSEPT